METGCARREFVIPEDAVEHPPVIDTGAPRGLLSSSGSITRHSKSVRSYRLMTKLNHDREHLKGVTSSAKREQRRHDRLQRLRRYPRRHRNRNR